MEVLCERQQVFRTKQSSIMQHMISTIRLRHTWSGPKKLRPTKVRVREGEVLYLPFGWWHQVRGYPAANGLCASLAMYFDPFFVRVSPKGSSRLGVLVPNPKYRNLCER